MIDAIPVPLELGVPLPSKYTHADLKRRVDAACATAAFLQEHGAEYPQPTKQDKEAAAQLAAAYAISEEKSAKEKNNTLLSKQTPQAIIYAKSILDEYGHRVADSAVQIRNTVTTKLIQETENADPKVRLKALELLGKISDVGLFSDKTEITVTHQTSDELKDKLRAKLEKLINPAPTSSHAKDTAKLEAIAVQDAEDLNFDDVPIEAEFEEMPDNT